MKKVFGFCWSFGAFFGLSVSVLFACRLKTMAEKLFLALSCPWTMLPCGLWSVALKNRLQKLSRQGAF